MTLSAPETGPASLGASFRDPSGFLFVDNGQLYRQINRSYAPDYDQLMQSGLYAELEEAGLLVRHEEVDDVQALTDSAYKVIRPEQVPFISYPYEWSFSQLKDAALTTLHIQKRALEAGMSLKDSSAYNIQFLRGRPVLIDTLSFERYQEGQPWVAYRQFCQHFLAPLSLMARRDVRLNQLLRVYIDGIPLDLASQLLPWRTRLSPSLLLHIHTHAASQQRYADSSVPSSGAKNRQMSRVGMLGLIDNLESAVRGLEWKPAGTEWGDYYDGHNYSDAGLDHKAELVGQYLDQVQPDSVWDLGANTGRFSRVASRRGIETVAFDIDPAAVEQNYRQIKEQSETNLLPLLLDLTNPSPALGWNNQERESWLARGPVDAVLALALIHHLAISNNVPLERLASFFHELAPWLIIEFVPKSDSQVQRLLASRQDIFPNYTKAGFEAAFSRFFNIQFAEPVRDSQRTLYLMEGKRTAGP